MLDGGKKIASTAASAVDQGLETLEAKRTDQMVRLSNFLVGEDIEDPVGAGNTVIL